MSSGMRMGQARGWVLVGFGVVICVRAGVGQEAPDFDAIRKTDFDSAFDRPLVQEWVKRQLDGLFSAPEPLTAGGLFYRQMLEHFNAPDATKGFKDGLAEMVAEAFTSRYDPQAPNAANTSPIPAVVVLAVLKSYDRPTALPCFKLGLKDPAPGVRLAAANGLLASRIEAQEWETLLPDLQQAAMDEANPVTLSRLYRVLTMDGGPEVVQVVAALLEILDARLSRFEQEGEFPALADAEAVTWMGGKLSGINDARMQNEITLRLARLLADAVHAYTHQDANKASKRQLARVIAIAEKQLKAIATAKVQDGRPQPDISTPMFEGGPDRDTRMATECDRWIGTDQSEGFLNAQPFNFKPGLNIKRAAPTTQPASRPASG